MSRSVDWRHIGIDASLSVYQMCAALARTEQLERLDIGIAASLRVPSTPVCKRIL